MKFDFITGNVDEGTAGDLLTSLANDLVSQLNPAQDVQFVYDTIIRQLNVIIDAIQGDPAWGQIASYLGDLAVGIANLFPQSRIVDIVSVLWDYAPIL